VKVDDFLLVFFPCYLHFFWGIIKPSCVYHHLPDDVKGLILPPPLVRYKKLGAGTQAVSADISRSFCDQRTVFPVSASFLALQYDCLHSPWLADRRFT